MDGKIKNFVSPYKKGEVISSDQAMQLAIDVAKLGAPYVSPNPLVGCVVVGAKHEFIDYGFHKKYGQDHAEVDALKKLTPEETKGATFYVTLEPCAHEGKTPSCAKTLAKLTIKKVVYGLIDPNPLVSGQGAKILTDAGIEAEEYQGPLKENLEEVCEVFLKNYKQKKVFIAAKVASSLDGQIALKTGESKWITSEGSREYVHELRSYYDAIIVGRNTIEQDNPSLNIRHPQIAKENKLVIIDPEAKILQKISDGTKFKFLEANKKENIFFAVKKVQSKFDCNQIEFTDLNQLTEKLWQQGLRSVFIEGGAKTYSEFLKANLIDRLYLFMAPTIIGNQNGTSWTHAFGIEALANQRELQNLRIEKYGKDIFITGHF